MWRMIKLIQVLLARKLKRYCFWLIVISLVYFLGLVPPYLIGRLIDFLSLHQPGQSSVPVYTLSGLLALVMIGASIIRLQAKDELSQMSIKAAYHARVLGFDRLMDRSVLWHQSESTGNKVQRIAVGSVSLENLLKSFFGEFLSVVITFIGTITSFFFASGVYGALGTGYFAAFLGIQTVFFLKIRALTEASKLAGENATGTYVEGASNILTIKTLNVEKNISATVTSREATSRDIKLRINKLNFLKWRCFQALTGLCMGGFVLKVSCDVIAGTTSPGSLAMLFAYFKTLHEAAGESTGLFDSLLDNWISVGRMAPLFEGDSGTTQGTHPFPTDWQSIDLRDVSVQYPGERGGLHHCSLSIRRGEHVGIIGTSGAGKSTLAKVLLGVLHPQQGSYEIGGISFSSLERNTTSHNMSMVLQDSELFNLSLRENVTVMRDVSPACLERAIRVSQLTSVVEKLDDGLATIIGERGYRLSGGERQRLGIARAICKSPEIIVLDEATSALDGETERDIHSALVSELGDKTFIIIAHRLSTLKSVDRIIVLEDGQVVEEGAPEVLLSNSESRFARMSRLQDSN
jgi:ABC-type multidrug transport system fused ATPase/permease subunit